jgi:predicted acylesterase/phospholipase RssA
MQPSSAWFLAAGGLAGAGSIGMLQAWTDPANWGGNPMSVPRIDMVSGVSIGALLSGPFAFTPRTVNEHGMDVTDSIAAAQCRRIILESAKHTCLLGVPNPFCCCCAPSILTMGRVEATLRRELVAKNYTTSRTCITWSTNLKTGRLESVSNHGGTTSSEYIDGMMASASIPLLLEPHAVRGDLCVDGAMRRVVPPMSADMASTVVDHIVICLCHAPQPKSASAADLKTGPGVLNAALGLTNLQVIKNDLREMLREIDGYNRAIHQLGYPRAQTHIVSPDVNFDHDIQGTTASELEFFISRGNEQMKRHLHDRSVVSNWHYELGLGAPAPALPDARAQPSNRLVL